jgi:hypothetical protein
VRLASLADPAAVRAALRHHTHADHD